MFDPGEKILIVDSMVAMRKLTLKICADLGIKDVLEASDVPTGWEMVNANPGLIQLVICDFQMPNGSGLDLLKRIRSDNRYAKIPFIMVATAADPKQIQEAIRAGVNSYLVKPFTVAILSEKITQIQKNKS